MLSNTIKKVVLKEAEHARETMREELTEHQDYGGTFSPASDEATSNHASVRVISLSLQASSLKEGQVERCF